MKILSNLKAIPLVVSLLLISLVAASCSSGGSSSAPANPSSKPANAAAILQNIFSQEKTAKNIEVNFSVNMGNIDGLIISSGDIPSTTKKEDKAIMSIFSNLSLEIAESKTSSSPGNGNVLIGINYSSQPIAQLMETIQNGKVVNLYMKVNVANIEKLPVPWPASAKSELPIIATIIQPEWYKFPSSLLKAAQANNSSYSQKISAELKGINLSKYQNFLADLLNGAFKSQVISNQGGETLQFSNNLYAILKWAMTDGEKQLKAILPSPASASTLKNLQIASILKKARARRLQKDSLTFSLEATSANELTAEKMSVSIVNPKNTKQTATFGFNSTFTYNNQISPPSNAINLPPALFRGLQSGLPSGLPKGL